MAKKAMDSGPKGDRGHGPWVRVVQQSLRGCRRTSCLTQHEVEAVGLVLKLVA